MRFIDEAMIRVSAGKGGPGCVAFRREKFIPRGGPNGGDGGDGGDVIFRASSNLSTLQDFRFKRVYQAGNGMNGQGSNKAGKDGENILIPVPVGTLIKESNTGELLKEFMEDGEEWVVCEGGRGGKGNAHFVSSTFQAPKFAQPGEEGEFKELTLELKLLADAAIIGFPNAGKSTLISRISAARPKIADYAFTTLTPNLGVVSTPDNEDSFVVADIPGLIEGAHRGMGLGHKFLRHIERTRVFIHLLDGTKLLEEATKPGRPRKEGVEAAVEMLLKQYVIIRSELGLFDEKLLHKPEIVAINKVDLMVSDPDIIESSVARLREKILEIRGPKQIGVEPIPGEPFVISAVSGTGVPELVGAVYKKVRLDEAQ